MNFTQCYINNLKNICDITTAFEQIYVIYDVVVMFHKKKIFHVKKNTFTVECNKMDCKIVF